jgi:hypothetical protein
LGKYWRSSPLVFSFEGRCHGLAFLAEEHRHAEGLADLGVQRHLFALIPGQRTT